jgi:hypothetical protein
MGWETDYLVKSRESLELLPYLINRLLKKRRPAGDERPIGPNESAAADHLLHEIDRVSRRVHGLHDSTVTDLTVAALREEIRQLRRYADDLANPKKSKI